MTKSLQIVALWTILVGLSVGGAAAQPDPRWLQADPKVVDAARTLRNVVDIVAVSVLGADQCKLGDRQPWLRVIGFVESRYAVCVREDRGWETFAQGLDQEREFAIKSRLATGAPMLLFMRAISAHGSRALDEGEAFCKDSRWKFILMPESVTADQIEEHNRVYPDKRIERAVGNAAAVLSLGKNGDWIDAPCGKNFWPPGFL